MTAGGDFTEFIRVLKEKNDIADVIGSYVKLERRGYQFWACCRRCMLIADTMWR